MSTQLSFSFSFLFFLLSCFFHPPTALADEPIWVSSEAYGEVEFGKYPVQHFKSSELIAPRVNLVRQSDGCENDLLTFFAPRGYVGAARASQATIIDSDGHLVWTTGWEGKQVYNLMAQEYQGQSYLTFWAGDDNVGGHGAGDYYMLDNTYTLKRTISAANGLDADLHDFRITAEGTALLTVYEVVDHDLSSLGKTNGPIWDCLVQEIDLETDELLFEWRAADHLNISDTYRDFGDDDAFDWFHINSIYKDLEGNYIVSSRYMHSVTYIDKDTGEVIWVLGGKRNDFEDLSDGKATDFAFQHDAKWANNFTEITLFDNTADGGDNPAQGRRIKVDQVAMTAELLQNYANPDSIPAASQGSMQDLPNGNVLLGFGFTAAWTEFTRDGKVLCDTHYAPKKQFGTGDAQSYRVLKYAWKGFPTMDPDIIVAQDDVDIWRVYVSWNGATEVESWVLQGNNEQANTWETLQSRSRDGFETGFMLNNGHPNQLRVKALDADGNVLGTTEAVDASHAEFAVAEFDPAFCKSRKESQWLLPIVILGAVGGTVAVGLTLRTAYAALRGEKNEYSQLASEGPET